MLPIVAAAAGATVLDSLLSDNSGPQTQTVDALTPEQKKLLGYSAEQARNFDTTYQGNAPEYFQQRYEDPMHGQYQSTLRGLQSTPERHASSRRNMEYGAQQSYLSSLGQARAEWLNQERLRQMQAAEAAKQRQLGYTQTALGTKAFDTMVTQPQNEPGLLGRIGQGLNLAGTGMGLYQGGQDAGMWGGGENLGPSQDIMNQGYKMVNK